MEQIPQPVLDEVPSWVRREMPEPANTMLKSGQWDDLLEWLQDNSHDTIAITATSLLSSQWAKVNLLGSLGGFRPAWGNSAHQACAEIIIKIFYQAGLINMKIGRSEETALLKAVTVGNYEIAQMLLDHGAGHPPCVIPFFFIRELLFGTP